MIKRGDVWISAVLYMGLGVLAITMILTAGMPLVQKLQDKNVIAQTKNLMFAVDENIRAVTNEGPGSRRFLDPFEVKKGELYIQDNMIKWKMDTKAKIMESGITLKEGSLSLTENETNIVEEYTMNLFLDYSSIATITLDSEYENPFQGVYGFTITNTGEFDETSGLPKVKISIK